jgi:Uma2 family endonuclease
MTLHMPHTRRFVPGTTGWTEEDLSDPRIERRWERGRYEIVEGILTKMPAALLDGSLPLTRLVDQVKFHLFKHSIPGEFGFEVDLVVNNIRVPKVDAVFLTPQQLQHQAALQAKRDPRRKVRYGRLRVPPELVIESISPGHELHDRQTKRKWYCGFEIPNYWLFDAYNHTLECLRLKAGEYRTDVAGKDQDELEPAMFPGLTIRLGQVWL